MIFIQVENITGQKIPYCHHLKSLLERVLSNSQGSVNLVFCNNAFIRKLNRDYRKIDKATDVLSFPFGEPDFLGEVYISTEKAKFQAPRWNNSYYQELKRLVVHGGLHLTGYDHTTTTERKIMQAREDSYLLR